MSASPQGLRKLEEVLDALRPRLRIAVLCGGENTDSEAVVHRTHHTRFWKSYETVALDLVAALRQIGFRQVLLLREGGGLAEQLRRSDVHLVWLNSGGVQGYDPLCHAPALLESLGIPYVGHHPAHAALLDDKVLFKRLLRSLGLPTAPFCVRTPGQALPLAPAARREVFGTASSPLVVKPANGRGSRDLYFVEDVARLPAVVAEIYARTHNPVLIESYLPGREVSVAAAPSLKRSGGRFVRTDGPWCFACTERLLGPGEHVFKSQDLCSIDRSRVRSLRADRDGELVERLETLGRAVFSQLHLRSMIRMDLREDANGELQILEANPKPDLKAPAPDGATSLLALGLEEAGISYTDLVLLQIASRLDEGLRNAPAALGPIVGILEEAGVLEPGAPEPWSMALESVQGGGRVHDLSGRRTRL